MTTNKKQGRRESTSTIMTDANTPDSDVAEVAAANKPKRVRTGCLTCRERHLKCDEGTPDCNNCKKSNRECKRGMKITWQYYDFKTPAVLLPKTASWKVAFQDESREIASEYKGGRARYASVKPSPTPVPRFDFPVRPHIPEPPQRAQSMQSLPPLQLNGMFQDNGLMVKDENNHSRNPSRHLSNAGSEGSSYLNALRSASFSNPELQSSPPPSEMRAPYLNSAEEVLYMQVFVEEVGIWMDSMDAQKHFSRQLPFHALTTPMLMNAFLACGARHLTLVNPSYHEDKALLYYDTATTQLLRALQNPQRDTVCCATTAVILNVYEIMSERAMQRMNHIAGARALIKECGWSARSTGIGAACFWLNVGMELLSCLHFNWQVAWNPDEWGLDMNFTTEYESCQEELWVHRILYVVGKVANFRALKPQFQQPSKLDEFKRLQGRIKEWQELEDLCNRWNDSIPATMHPMAILAQHQTTSGSKFPEVWLIKRATIVGRLFYHTAKILLAQINPEAHLDPENAKIQLHHSHQVCGIVAHVKDRGVASVAIRSLAIAAECLTDRSEQAEVLQIFDKIRKETGWKVGFLHTELKQKWKWSEEPAQNDVLQQQSNSSTSSTSLGNFNGGQSLVPPAPQQVPRSMPKPPSGIVNPLYGNADFSLPKHPYQTHYTPPSLGANLFGNGNLFPPPFN